MHQRVTRLVYGRNKKKKERAPYLHLYLHLVKKKQNKKHNGSKKRQRIKGETDVVFLFFQSSSVWLKKKQTKKLYT